MLPVTQIGIIYLFSFKRVYYMIIIYKQSLNKYLFYLLMCLGLREYGFIINIKNCFHIICCLTKIQLESMIQIGKTDPGFNDEIDEQNAPHEFLCPISKQIMKNPVITMDGYSFQKQVIEKWFASQDKSPITGLKIEKKIIDNRALKQAIRYHNERDSKANQNALKLLQNANQYIQKTLPQFLNDINLVDVDKLVTISIQNIQLRRVVSEIKKQLTNIYYRLNLFDSKMCENCFKTMEGLKTVDSFLKSAENILETEPIISKLDIQAKQFYYLPISCDDLKNIDFQYIKKSDFQKKIFKSYGIQNSPLEDLVKRIRAVNKIPNKNFINVWRANIAVDKLYDHIQKSLTNQSCNYIRKVKSVGTKITNLKVRFQDLNLNPGEYLILQNGIDEELVFRGDLNKCQYCYNVKPEKFKCTCLRVSYCSKTCAQKDIEFHAKQCPAYRIVPVLEDQF